MENITSSMLTELTAKRQQLIDRLNSVNQFISDFDDFKAEAQKKRASEKKQAESEKTSIQESILECEEKMKTEVDRLKAENFTLFKQNEVKEYFESVNVPCSNWKTFIDSYNHACSVLPKQVERLKVELKESPENASLISRWFSSLAFDVLSKVNNIDLWKNREEVTGLRYTLQSSKSLIVEHVKPEQVDSLPEQVVRAMLVTMLSGSRIQNPNTNGNALAKGEPGSFRNGTFAHAVETYCNSLGIGTHSLNEARQYCASLNMGSTTFDAQARMNSRKQGKYIVSFSGDTFTLTAK